MKTERFYVRDVLSLQRRPTSVEIDQTYVEIGVRSFGRGLFHKDPVSGQDLGSKRVFYIKEGDMIFSNVFAWEGAVAIATEQEDGLIGSHRFMTYRVNERLADARYLFHYFTGGDGLSAIRNASPGSAGRNRTLGIKSFAAQSIDLPGLQEQQRIAARLDYCRSLVGQVQSRATDSGALLAALRQQLLADFYARHQASLTPLGSVAAVFRGRGPRYEHGSGSIALNQGCVQWGGIHLSRAREVEVDWESSVPDVGRVAEGDVLVNSTGDGTIGRACVAGRDVVGIPFDSHILSVRVTPGFLLPEFLALMIQSPQVQSVISSVKGANTTKQTELGKKKLEKLQVPVPSVEEQNLELRRLRDLLARASEVENLGKLRDQLAEALSPALLKAAFAGHL
ncbi:restriction endonuclease subunit S [Actinomadura sp. KC216]|uniref:restriction endonuclease subunit S n=1 Tax=Actinomadura sp. KC216 TaxID=2530370 RepID=UPI001046457B|nr:restriction endonuclease subunit S [Actinomadura sp. KC216]TDB84031.1 restriction endonuclease subunit S [Actinomadura sp. KC216]